MTITTKRFGQIDISDDRIINFDEGIPGFENLKRFIVIILEQTKPFFWLQAVDEDIALPVISPFDFNKDYSPIIDDSVFEELQIQKQEELLVLNVAVIPGDSKKMTANMAAPILINIVKNCGKQIIINGGDYSIRQPIFEKVCELVRRGQNAGSDAQGK